MGSEIATSPYSINCANRQCWLHSVRRRRIHCFLCMRPLSTRQPIVQGFCWAHGSPTSKSTSAPPATSQSFSITAETRLLAAHGMQCPLDALGIARDDGEVGFTGWSGSERPCSQSRRVPRGILKRAANSSWVSARARRSVLTRGMLVVQTSKGSLLRVQHKLPFSGAEPSEGCRLKRPTAREVPGTQQPQT